MLGLKYQEWLRDDQEQSPIKVENGNEVRIILCGLLAGVQHMNSFHGAVQVVPYTLLSRTCLLGRLSTGGLEEVRLGLLPMWL